MLPHTGTFRGLVAFLHVDIAAARPGLCFCTPAEENIPHEVHVARPRSLFDHAPMMFCCWMCVCLFRGATQAHFETTPDAQLRSFAEVLHRCLRRLHVVCAEPDFNLIIRSAPVAERGRQRARAFRSLPLSPLWSVSFCCPHTPLDCSSCSVSFPVSFGALGRPASGLHWLVSVGTHERARPGLALVLFCPAGFQCLDFLQMAYQHLSAAWRRSNGRI